MEGRKKVMQGRKEGMEWSGMEWNGRREGMQERNGRNGRKGRKGRSKTPFALLGPRAQLEHEPHQHQRHVHRKRTLGERKGKKGKEERI